MNLQQIALIGVLTAGVAAYGGWKAGYASAEQKAKAAQAALMEKQNAELKKRQEALDEAVSKLDASMRDADDLRRNAVRLRERANARAAADRGSGSCNPERLARCESLLGEGADLVGEGAEISIRIAGKKDVLASQLK